MCFLEKIANAQNNSIHRIILNGIIVVGFTSSLSISFSNNLYAQNTFLASPDWSGNYSFSSTGDRNLRLLQADILEKHEQGYYESLGKTTVNQYVNTNINTDNSTNIDGNLIYDSSGQQNTYSVGAINNSSTTINNNGNYNNIDVSNSAESEGCQNASINISESGTSAGSAGCQ